MVPLEPFFELEDDIPWIFWWCLVTFFYAFLSIVLLPLALLFTFCDRTFWCLSEPYAPSVFICSKILKELFLKRIHSSSLNSDMVNHSGLWCSLTCIISFVDMTPNVLNFAKEDWWWDVFNLSFFIKFFKEIDDLPNEFMTCWFLQYIIADFYYLFLFHDHNCSFSVDLSFIKRAEGHSGPNCMFFFMLMNKVFSRCKEVVWLVFSPCIMMLWDVVVSLGF